jgi:hypothetical protein
VGRDGVRYAGDLGEESRRISEKQNYSADAPRSGLDQSDVPEDDGLHALLAIRGKLDWCGLVDVRRAPIATEFCVAEKYRDVPIYSGLACAGRRPLTQPE